MSFEKFQTQGKNVAQLQSTRKISTKCRSKQFIKYLKIQNHQAVLDLDVVRIKGDAELKGDPYSITNEPFNNIIMQSDVQFIMTESNLKLMLGVFEMSLIGKDMPERSN